MRVLPVVALSGWSVVAGLTVACSSGDVSVQQGPGQAVPINSAFAAASRACDSTTFYDAGTVEYIDPVTGTHLEITPVEGSHQNEFAGLMAGRIIARIRHIAGPEHAKWGIRPGDTACWNVGWNGPTKRVGSRLINVTRGTLTPVDLTVDFHETPHPNPAARVAALPADGSTLTGSGGQGTASLFHLASTGTQVQDSAAAALLQDGGLVWTWVTCMTNGCCKTPWL